MKKFLPVTTILILLILTLVVRAFAASPQPSAVSQTVVTATLAMTMTPQAESSPTATPQAIVTVTALASGMSTPTVSALVQPTPGNTGSTGPKMGMRMGMDNNNKMGSRMSMKSEMHKRKGVSAGKDSDMDGWASMMGAPMMSDSIASMLGMTTQDLYNQIASGKTVAQIAAEKGITHEQLSAAMMTGDSIWSDPVMSVIYGHYLTGYELTGKHIQVPCVQCHVNYQYENTPTNCNDCHAKDDVHKGGLGTDCAACHTTVTWKR